MLQYDDAFWHDHEQRRLEQGLSVPQCCAANGLALSTFRHRVNGKKRTNATPRPAPAALVEVALEGMMLRLSGEAAERVLARVMSRLA